jgi:hypothetical protein
MTDQRTTFIQSVYDTINIYYSFVIYPDCLAEDFDKLKHILETDDFPVYTLPPCPTPETIEAVEARYRMLFMTESTFEQYLQVKNNNISHTNVIFSGDEPLFSRKYRTLLEGVQLFSI